MICLRCNNDKDTLEFHVNKSSKSGYQSFCKICNKEAQKLYYINNRKSVLDRKMK